MAWKQLTKTDLETILSKQEADLLNTTSTATPTAVNAVIDLVADMWRGRLLARSIAVDIRAHYVPPELAYWILVHARYAVWTRFPSSPAIALDEARKNEYDQAMKLLGGEVTIGVSSPEYAYSSDNPSNGADTSGAIRLPFFTRFDYDLCWNWPRLSGDLQ